MGARRCSQGAGAGRVPSGPVLRPGGRPPRPQPKPLTLLGPLGPRRRKARASVGRTAGGVGAPPRAPEMRRGQMRPAPRCLARWRRLEGRAARTPVDAEYSPRCSLDERVLTVAPADTANWADFHEAPVDMAEASPSTGEAAIRPTRWRVFAAGACAREHLARSRADGMEP
eukprot:scaffold13914_cov122-Isochrysis_galbana.AAC.2